MGVGVRVGARDIGSRRSDGGEGQEWVWEGKKRKWAGAWLGWVGLGGEVRRKGGKRRGGWVGFLVLAIQKGLLDCQIVRLTDQRVDL